MTKATQYVEHLRRVPVSGHERMAMSAIVSRPNIVKKKKTFLFSSSNGMTTDRISYRRRAARKSRQFTVYGVHEVYPVTLCSRTVVVYHYFWAHDEYNKLTKSLILPRAQVTRKVCPLPTRLLRIHEIAIFPETLDHRRRAAYDGCESGAGIKINLPLNFRLDFSKVY